MTMLVTTPPAIVAVAVACTPPARGGPNVTVGTEVYPVPAVRSETAPMGLIPAVAAGNVVHPPGPGTIVTVGATV